MAVNPAASETGVRSDRLKDERMDEKTYPEGHFPAVGIAIGIPLGIPVGLLFGDAAFIGIGAALGGAIGLVIGTASENRYKQNGQIVPLSPEVKKRRTRLLTIAAMVGAVVAVGLALYVVFR